MSGESNEPIENNLNLPMTVRGGRTYRWSWDQPGLSLVALDTGTPTSSTLPLERAEATRIQLFSRNTHISLPGLIKKIMSKSLPVSCRPQLVAALSELHKAGFVYGKLTPNNILIDRNGKALLTDFEWAGHYDRQVKDDIPDHIRSIIPAALLGVFDNYVPTEADKLKSVDIATYPIELSKEKYRAAKAEPLGQIRPMHDWMMFHALVFEA